MYSIMVPRSIVFGLLLAFLLMVFSASSCAQTGADSYLNNSTSTDYRTLASNEAVNAGIPSQLFVRQIQVESGFNPYAISQAGAIGIAQIMPKTAQRWGVDPHDPVASLRVAADHMHWYYQHYGYDYSKALACYNGGCDRLEWAMANCANYYWCLYPETRHYINIIMV